REYALPFARIEHQTTNIADLVAADVVEVHGARWKAPAAICARTVLELMNACRQSFTPRGPRHRDALNVKRLVSAIPAALVLTVIFASRFRIFPGHLTSAPSLKNRDFSFPKASRRQWRERRSTPSGASGRVTDSAKRPESVTARPYRVDGSERNVSSGRERK